MDDAVGPGCSEENNTRTGTGIMGDADKPEGAEGKVDITIPKKTNKISILVSY